MWSGARVGPRGERIGPHRRASCAGAVITSHRSHGRCQRHARQLVPSSLSARRERAPLHTRKGSVWRCYGYLRAQWWRNLPSGPAAAFVGCPCWTPLAPIGSRVPGALPPTPLPANAGSRRSLRCLAARGPAPDGYSAPGSAFRTSAAVAATVRVRLPSAPSARCGGESWREAHRCHGPACAGPCWLAPAGRAQSMCSAASSLSLRSAPTPRLLN